MKLEESHNNSQAKAEWQATESWPAGWKSANSGTSLDSPIIRRLQQSHWFHGFIFINRYIAWKLL